MTPEVLHLQRKKEIHTKKKKTGKKCNTTLYLSVR